MLCFVHRTFRVVSFWCLLILGLLFTNIGTTFANNSSLYTDISILSVPPLVNAFTAPTFTLPTPDKVEQTIAPTTSAQENPEPQVTAVVTTTQTIISPGDTFTATVTITNTGDIPLPDYSLNLFLSDGLTLLSKQTISGTLPSLKPGASQEWIVSIGVSKAVAANQYVSLYGTAQNAPIIDEYIELFLKDLLFAPVPLASSAPDKAPESWVPRFVTPEVSLFSGAATYNYPFDVIPGRLGLQPTLALAYSHHNSEAIIMPTSSGDYYEGWNLTGVLSITHKFVLYNDPQKLDHKLRWKEV